MSSDSDNYATRPDWTMNPNMSEAPLGKKLLLLNEGGVLVFGTLTNNNRDCFIQWSELPRKAKC